MNELLPNGVLGVALAGLLASFMAGMAANVSSLNTVFTYDLWQDWLRPGRDDRYYLRVGRAVTVIGCVLAIGTAFIAGTFANIMNYIQALFSFFNAPLFAIFILGLFWKRMTGTAGWTGLIAGALSRRPGRLAGPRRRHPACRRRPAASWARARRSSWGARWRWSCRCSPPPSRTRSWWA